MEHTNKRIVKVIAEQLGLEDSQVTPEKNVIVDFSADSLDTIELVMALEDEFGIEITDDDAEKCATVQDINELVARLIKS